MTLGCPKNEADSRRITRLLSLAGIVTVSDPEDSTHILINTCGFIQDAKEESIAAILEACADYPDKCVMVMGCLVERYREELMREIPEVSGWFGLAGGPDEPGLVRSLGSGAGLSLPENGDGSGAGGDSRHRRVQRTSYAYVKISDGCDEFCTFCAIPTIKGSYYSIGAQEVLREADDCLREGARELVLVGQNTAIWSSDGLDLAGLVDMLAADERVRRIRIMYLQPEDLTSNFLQYMAEQPKLCRYLDIPFQHSHPTMLRAMGRWGDGDAYLALLREARRLMPDVSVRSAFIVGFPGETDEHFAHLMNFVEEARFDYAGGFVYSPEEGTVAAKLRPRIRRKTAQERLNRLNTILQASSEQMHQAILGETVNVMIDSVEIDEAGESVGTVGHTEGQAPEVDGVTYVEGCLPDGTEPGDVLKVKVDAAVGYDLVGTIDAA